MFFKEDKYKFLYKYFLNGKIYIALSRHHTLTLIFFSNKEKTIRYSRVTVNCVNAITIVKKLNTKLSKRASFFYKNCLSDV